MTLSKKVGGGQNEITLLSVSEIMYQKCHYFSREGGGPKRNYFALLLCHFVTIGQGRVGDKANLENVTRYEVFFFEASLIST